MNRPTSDFDRALPSQAAEALCPLCSGRGGKPAHPYGTTFQGRPFGFFACRICATRFIDPLPDAQTLAALYEPEVYHDHFYAASVTGRHAASVGLLRERLPAGARVLDYGCGNGDFLLAVRAAGLDAHGAEHGASARAAEARSGCPVIDLAEVRELPRDWDAVHVADVLEHLVEPRAIMGAVIAALKPGGLLVVEGPLEANASLVACSAALFARLKGTRGTANRFVPWHLFLTNARAQRAFFAGFPLVEVQWTVWESGWPYLHNGAVRHGIALLARAFARLPGARGRVGNRFRALYRKPG